MEGFSPELNSIAMLGLKLLFLAFFALYAFFAFIVTRQVGLMRRTIETPIHGGLVAASWIYFLLAVFVALMALVIL